MIANTAAAPTTPPAIAPACDDDVPLARVVLVGMCVAEIVEVPLVVVLAAEAKLPMAVGVVT